MKVGDRFLCNHWDGVVFKVGKIYTAVRVEINPRGELCPIVVSEMIHVKGKVVHATIAPVFLERGEFTALGPAPVTDDGAAEYEEIMRMQEAIHGEQV